MKSRHKKASGGRVFYAGGESNVAKEAEEKKHGGRVKKHMGKVHGEKPKMRMDKRARGGRIGSGSDRHPFSSAHSVTSDSTGDG